MLPSSLMINLPTKTITKFQVWYFNCSILQNKGFGFFLILPYPISWWIWQFERGTLSTQKKKTPIFFLPLCAWLWLEKQCRVCMGGNTTVFLPIVCWERAAAAEPQTSRMQGSGYPTRGMAALHPAQGEAEVNAVMFCLVPWDKVVTIIWHLYWDKRRLHPLDASLTFLSFPLFQQMIILPKMDSTLQLLLSHFSLFPC